MFPYKNFNKFILRRPAFSINSFLEIFDSLTDLDDPKVITFLNNEYFKEAILLASPDLYFQMLNLLEGKITDKKKEKNLILTLLKYFCRICSRSTPYGLFAGYSVGEISNKTSINNLNLLYTSKFARLDTLILFELTQSLSVKFKNFLNFSPNNTLKKYYDGYKYIERRYNNGIITHHDSIVESSIFIEEILAQLQYQNLSIKEIAKIIKTIDHTINDDEIDEFITELIENQILISELEPSLTKKDFFQQLLEILLSKNSNKLYNVINKLKEINLIIHQIEETNTYNINVYSELLQKINDLDIQFNPKFLLQIDLKTHFEDLELNKTIFTKIKGALCFLNNLSEKQNNQLLNDFKIKFRERYEDEEVPLLQALDEEIGIGYNSKSFDKIHPGKHFLNNINITRGKSEDNKIEWNKIDKYLQKKIINSHLNNEKIISLKYDEIPNINQWDDLPSTISFMIEIFNDQGIEKIKFQGGGGICGMNFFSRFCMKDDELNEYAKKFIEIDKRNNADKILADIIHLPEPRMGNILLRPSFNDYDITYISSSLKPDDKQIKLSDIYISIKESGEIILKSKRLGKIIIPRLLNMHNFSYNTTPIYNFLCDVQFANNRDGIWFKLRNLESKHNYIPRIELENIILYNATWSFTKSDIKDLITNKSNKLKLKQEIREFRNKWKIPKYITFNDQDNKLLINLENDLSLILFLELIEGKSRFTISEFLLDDSQITNDIETFAHEIIISMYKE